MKYIGTALADLHTGVISDTRLLEEVENIYLYNMRNMKQLDFIIILGDFFNAKEFANTKAIDCAMIIMSRIVAIAKEKNSKIRIVYGTESHDADQYRLFRIYENDPELDFKIIRTCSDEELFPNINVLYLPEEYLRDSEEYYHDYFKEKEKYDFVFGHGVIKEIMTEATRNIDKSKNDRNRLKVPSFSSFELSKICKGKVLFGHYHENEVIDDKVYYVGSYTRWKFGEEKDKGYYEIKLNNDKYDVKFIKNYLARTYKTFFYGYDSEIFESQNKLISELKKLDVMIDYHIYDNIRLMLNIPDNIENPNLIMDLIKEKYKSNKHVKAVISNSIVEKMKKQHDDKVDEIINKYNIIFDKNVKLEDKIKYFMKNKFNRDIDIEDIKKYLYSDLEIILQGDNNNE